MFHTIVFSEAIDSASLVPIAAVQDSQIAVSGDDVLIPEGLSNLGYAAPVGAVLTSARLVSPELRRIADMDLVPFGLATEAIARPFVHDWMPNPIPLLAGEALNFQAGSDGAGDELLHCVVGLSDGPTPPIQPVGVRSVRFTAAITCVANVWVNGAITFDQNLRGGTYQVVGCQVFSATGIAFRLVFPDQGPRPGGVAFDAESDVGPPMFRYGGTGVWGTFGINQPPTLDILSITTDTVQQGIMDLVRVGGVGA